MFVFVLAPRAAMDALSEAGRSPANEGVVRVLWRSVIEVTFYPQPAADCLNCGSCRNPAGPPASRGLTTSLDPPIASATTFPVWSPIAL